MAPGSSGPLGHSWVVKPVRGFFFFFFCKFSEVSKKREVRKKPVSRSVQLKEHEGRVGPGWSSLAPLTSAVQAQDLEQEGVRTLVWTLCLWGRFLPHFLPSSSAENTSFTSCCFHVAFSHCCDDCLCSQSAPALPSSLPRPVCECWLWNPQAIFLLTTARAPPEDQGVPAVGKAGGAAAWRATKGLTPSISSWCVHRQCSLTW